MSGIPRMVVTTRQKQWEPSSSSEEFNLQTGVLSIEFFNAMKDQFRIAPGNKIPVPWPTVSLPASAGFKTILTATHNSWTKILKDYGIKMSFFMVHALGRKDIENTAKDTLIVCTTDTVTIQWNNAATKIYELLEGKAKGLPFRVEIRNEDLMYQDVSFPVESNTVGHTALKLVEPLVLAHAKRFTRSWNIISFALRGPADGPIIRIPTVLIAFSPKEHSSWFHIEKGFRDAIAMANMDTQVAVELIASDVMCCLEPGQPRVPPFVIRDMPSPAVNGASIGPQDSTDNTGSLGIWMWLQPQGENTKQACFLTCYHVIRLGDQRNVCSHDEKGIGLNGDRSWPQICVNYPALRDANDTREVLEAEISAGKDKDGRRAKVIELMDQYTSWQGIAKVAHASGNRKTPSGSRADWAIVTTNREVPWNYNMPPSEDKFSPAQLGHWCYEAKPGEIITKLGKFKEDAWVAKIGRTTGVTTATVNSLNAHFANESGTASHPEVELLSFPEGRKFVGLGDSGAMVINIDKECVGMIYAKARGCENAYAMRIEDILEDVSRTTGGTLTLITK